LSRLGRRKAFGTPIFILCKTLKRVKDVLKDFNEFFSKILKRVLMARKATEDV
jgi:hypothetical protein